MCRDWWDAAVADDEAANLHVLVQMLLDLAGGEIAVPIHTGAVVVERMAAYREAEQFLFPLRNGHGIGGRFWFHRFDERAASGHCFEAREAPEEAAGVSGFSSRAWLLSAGRVGGIADLFDDR